MNKKGFTLIELLVVVLIIGILAAIALPQYFRAVERSRAAEAISIMGSLGSALERARMTFPQTDANSFPTSLGLLDIEFTQTSGTNTISTVNFSITWNNTGLITATRKSGGLTIYRCARTGTMGCVGDICPALGANITVGTITC